ncbi:MAG TPA: hypothetical protein VGK73_15475 [Polyangiaceae bacterium]
MTLFGLSGGRRALTAAVVGLFLAIACSTPTYTFVDDTAPHCENRVEEPELGETDLDCGGPECNGCTYGQKCGDTTDCAVGQCLLGFCQEPGCENHELDGEETAVDCGGGCPGCRDGQPCRVSTDCQSKVCGEDELCASASCDDGVRNGDELSIDCGGAFCEGGCGIGDPCLVPSDCESVACDAETQTCALNCARGTDECDGDLEEPCETNLLTSIRNCGECGEMCDLAHAEASCIGGTCQIETCAEPWIRCNTEDEDGCEINSSVDPMNCGGCGMVCPDLHGEPSCVNSTCVIECEEGFGDCDENPLTGCETSVNDVENCGRCGRVCPDDEGTPNCREGVCGVTSCADGLGDCNADMTCETSLDTDPLNCGRCGNICSAANGSVDCVDGRCVITACEDGWENCDDDEPDGGFSTGCEANVTSDARNCGGCGTRCDVVDNGTGTCQGGSCDLACNAGFQDCDGRVDTGCEANTRSDPEFCGGCDNACDIPNARAECVDSECGIDECLGAFENCTSGGGCETDTSSSVQHCGECDHACSRSGATAVSCSGGRCAAPTCDSAHRSCDGNNDNGRETDVTTTAACGACGNVCGAATPNCVLSGSTYRCQARIAIANAQPYPNAQVASGSLTFKATPHAGTNRVVLLAVASESQGNGLTGARPDSVTFGGQAMSAGPSQVGANDTWGPDLFVYYLAIGDAAAAQAQVDVVIDATSAPAATVIVAQQLLLTGARQTTPLTGSAGGFLGTSSPEAPDPSVITVTVPVAVSGSAIYSFTSALWMDGGNCTPNTPSSNCPAWSVSPSTNLTVTETLAMAPVTVSGAPLRTFGMFISATSPSLPAVGDYQPRWSIPYSGRMTHLAVAIAPAQSP